MLFNIIFVSIGLCGSLICHPRLVIAKDLSQDDQEAQKAQLCEGYYFIGMELLRRDRQKDAIGYWKQATKSKLPKLSAYRGAVFALKNSGVEVR